jgi:hypothetical protein
MSRWEREDGGLCCGGVCSLSSLVVVPALFGAAAVVDRDPDLSFSVTIRMSSTYGQGSLAGDAVSFARLASAQTSSITTIKAPSATLF